MQSPWVQVPVPRPAARRRLFCFPYAGGGTAIYRTWSDHLPPEIELCTVRLPGREGRFTEPPLRRMKPLLTQLAHGVLPYLDRGFGFWGHSLGALVAFELARTLRDQGQPTPMQVFVSGRRAPHLPDAREPGAPPLHTLPDAELAQELRRLDGTPEEVLAHPELLELMLPVLRADIEISETYEHREGEPLGCPITAFGGLGDEDVPQDSLAAWQRHTRGRFGQHMLPGHHFFLHTMHGAILHAVARELGAGSEPEARP